MSARSLGLIAVLIVVVGVSAVVLFNKSGPDDDLTLEAPLVEGDGSEEPVPADKPKPATPTGEGITEKTAREPKDPKPGEGAGTYAVKAQVLDAETRAPLQGVRVRVFEPKESQPYRETLTDAEGRFTLSGLVRKTVYSGTAWKEGYAKVRRHGLSLSEEAERTEVVLDPIFLGRAGAAAGTVSTEQGNLIEGAQVIFHRLKKTPDGILYPDRSEVYTAFTDVDGRYENKALAAGAYRVMAQAQGYARSLNPSLDVEVGATALADFILKPESRVSGTVCDQQGRPVKGARIYGDFQGKGGPFELPETAVADDGTFSIPHLPSGACSLVVRAKGYAQKIRVGVPIPSENVDIVLGLANGAIEGRVEGPEGPLDAFRIKYYEEKPSNYQLAAAAILKAKFKTFEDAKGVYRITGLAHGLYMLEVYAEGCMGNAQGGIQLKEGETKSGVDFKLGMAYPLKGKVLRKADGLPIKGAEIVVNLVIKGPFGEIPFRPSDIKTTSDETGAWELTELKEGAMSISVTHPEYGKATKKGIKIKPDEPPAEIEIRMETGGRVAGTCRDKEGKGVFGDYIVIQNPQDPSNRYTLQADKDGRYASQLLAPGFYQVIRVDSKDTTKVKIKFATVKPGETVTIDFGEPMGCTVHGVVTAVGKPVPNCQVVLIEVGEERAKRNEMGVCTTDEKGAYELRGLKPGKYYVFAQTGQIEGSGRARTFRVEFAVSANQPDVRVDIAFPSGSFSGTVLDAATGKPIAGATIVVMQSDTPDVRTFDEIIEHFGGQTRSDTNGAFEVGGLIAGRYTVQAIMNGFARKVLDARDLGSGENIRLTIALGPESRIEGKVTGPTGVAVENAAIYMLDEAGNTSDFTFGTTFTDSGGAYVVQGLPEGTYVLLIEAPGFASTQTGTVTVLRSGVVKKDFTMAAEGRIKIAVTSGGIALKDAVVKVFDATGKEVRRRINERNMYTSTRERKTGENGTVVVAMLPVGAYRLTVTAAGASKTVDVALETPGEKAVAVEMGP